MKDISINKWYMKLQYSIAWVSFILFGFIFLWIIAFILSKYGENTSKNVKWKRDILNKTWQKLVFIYGSIMGDIFIILLIMEFI